MYNIAKIKLTASAQWTNLEDFIKTQIPDFSLTVGQVYSLQGDNFFTICIKKSEQMPDKAEGVTVKPLIMCNYTYNAEEKVYIKTLVDTFINILNNTP